jgi:hypothetical protein
MWIESHQELGRHPKTKRLARSLGVSVPAAIGHLHLLWWWSLDFAQDGSLDGFEAAEIADAAMWEGDPVPFYAALVTAGFIDGDEVDHYRLHDWDEYVGKLLDRRKSNAIRQKTWRDRHRNEGNTADDPSPNDPVTVTSPLRNGATVPNLTVPNLTVPESKTSSGDEANVNGHAAPNGAVTLAMLDSVSVGAEPEPAPPSEPWPDAAWIDDAFEQSFWPAYPRKTHKADARTAWRKRMRAQPTYDAAFALAESILEVLSEQSDAWTDPRVTPHAATYLNGERWTDEQIIPTGRASRPPAEPWPS